MERRWKVLIVTAVAVFMGFLDVTIVNVAFPDIEDSFAGSSRSDLSWILNAYNIVFAALLVPAGRLADLVGRRRMFAGGVVGFIVASVLCGVAPSPEWLVAARVLQAAAGAILVPTSLALLLPEFPAEKRATAVAIWGATGAVAAALGPSLGGVLVDQAGWRWVFFVNVPIGLAALLPARRLLREYRDPAGVLPDVLGSLLLVAGVGALALGIVKGPEWGWDSARVIGSLAAAALLVPAMVPRSARHRAPVIELAHFRVRSFAVANGGMFSFSTAFYALLLCNVLFLTQVWGMSILEAGFAVTPGPLMAAAFAPIGGRLSDRFGQRVVALPGALLFALGCALFATGLDSSRDYATEFLIPTILTGAGVGLSFAAWSSAAVAELPPERFATGSAVLACVRQIGAVLGIAIVVAVLEAATPGDAIAGFTDAYTLMALAGGLTTALALILGRVRSAASAPEAAAEAAA
ncbi:MAG TPA: DHA2 family efflux MFS transporter permease subunit [Thermoleophilaceae bacterium]|nr:DHA2 family efflux MFS transporter permease subunit [Thermoleophilaceae bacterium]